MSSVDTDNLDTTNETKTIQVESEDGVTEVSVGRGNTDTTNVSERNNIINEKTSEAVKADIMKEFERNDVLLEEKSSNDFIVVNVYKHRGDMRSQNVNIYAGQTRTNFQRRTPPKSPSGNANSSDGKGLFVRCILLMAFTMFLFTGIFVSYVMMTPGIKYWLSYYVLYTILISMTFFFIIDYAFVCVKCSRVGPCNFVLLCLTVLSLSTVAATISARTDSEVLLFAIIVTTITVLVAVFLTCSKFDFKSYKLYIVMLGTAFGVIVLSVIILVGIGARFFDALWLLLLVVITFVQIVLIVMQLQSMLGGTTIELKDNDYALGAFMLYGSVFDIVIKMLQIAGVTRDMDER